MSAYRALYRCNGCQMELHLLGPVDRPCPGCGGNFERVYNHPMEALGDIMGNTAKTREDNINEIVAREFPGLIAKLEEYLYAHVEMDKYSRGEGIDQEEGLPN